MPAESQSKIVPCHVAIIMDGNGRWAKQRKLSRIEGHRAGAKSVQAVMKACRKTGVRYLTLFAFSTENWIRPETEIRPLMMLLVDFLKEYEKDLHQQKIRLRVIGRIDDLPRAVQSVLRKVMRATEQYADRQLILALSYGARDEITQAARKIAQRVKDNEIKVENIDEELVRKHLFAPDVPDPDLLIRTGNERRLSNFLLWQASYTELYFTEKLWPDFREDDFVEALEKYSKRQRRFGDIIPFSKQ